MGKTKSFPTRIKKETRMSAFNTLFNLLDVLATAIRQEKETKCIQIGKEKIKLSLFVDNMVLYIENPIGSTKKTIQPNK